MQRPIKLFLLFSSLFIIIILSGCTDLMGNEYGDIFTERIFQTPHNYINLTEEHIKLYPHLMESINHTDTHIKVPSNEWYALKSFFGNTFANVSYQGKYYYVRLFGFI